MSKYNDLIADLKKGGKGSNYSKNDMVALATTMFNDSEASIPVYVKRGDTFEVVEHNPGKAVRDNLIAPILKTFGVDKAELGKLETQSQTSRAGGEALADFALLLIKQYISQDGLGRKLTLPMTSPKETVQSIQTTSTPAESRNTTMIIRTADGKYETAPTGKTVTTEEHQKVKVMNRVPVWLKKTADAK